MGPFSKEVYDPKDQLTVAARRRLELLTNRESLNKETRAIQRRIRATKRSNRG